MVRRVKQLFFALMNCFAIARNDRKLVACNCHNVIKSLSYQPFFSLLHSNYSSLRAIAKQSQQGFTLLEMVLVLFLISLLASTTLFLTENLDDQASYDETKRRMEIIRQAIVGDPTRRINGQTEISGFASDMGRLPNCLAELIEVSSAVPSTSPKEYLSPCGGSSANIKEWHVDVSTGIASGWRGPYIQVTPESNGDRRFRDGYGNSDTSDAQNSGWNYSVDASGAISITSLGRDATSSTDDDLSDSHLVNSSDWQLTHPVKGLISITNISSAAQPQINDASDEVLVRIYNKNFTHFYDSDAKLNVVSGAIGAIDSVSPSPQIQLDFQMDSSVAISTGMQGYVLVCSDGGSEEFYKLFNGDCTSGTIPTAADVKTFYVAPRQIPRLNWTIQ